MENARKMKKNSLVDQVIDELNEDLGPSGGTSSLFITDSKEEGLGDIDENLVEFKPDTSNKTSSTKEEKQVKEDRQITKVMAAPSPEAFQMSGTHLKNDAPMNMTLQQSEHLRLAQERINYLEAELARLRVENEELGSAGKILKSRLDEKDDKNINLERFYKDKLEELQAENQTLEGTVRDLGKEKERIQMKNEELEKRISNKLQGIRIRERDLENSIEMMQSDHQVLLRDKDKQILDLKRQTGMMKDDLESQKMRYNKLAEDLEDIRSRNKRITGGLRVVLDLTRGQGKGEVIQDSQNSEEQKEVENDS